MRLVSMATLLVASVAITLSRPLHAQTGLAFDHGQPPPTLEAMWDRADLVVYGHAASTTGPKLLGHTGDMFRPVARFVAVSVAEILKSDPKAQATPSITVLQVGGTVRSEGQTFSTAENEPALGSLHDVVLFLTRAPVYSAYVTVSGDAGIFPVDGKTHMVKMSVSARHMPGLSSDAAVTDFLTKLRSLRTRR